MLSQTVVQNTEHPTIWWGEVVFSRPESTDPNACFIGRHIFVEANCKCAAEDAIKAIFQAEHPRVKIMDIKDTVPGKYGPYKLTVSKL